VLINPDRTSLVNTSEGRSDGAESERDKEAGRHQWMIREGQGMGQHIHSQCDSSRVGTESLERVESVERDQRENAFVLLGEGSGIDGGYAMKG